MRIILILILCLNILTETEFEKCIRISKKYSQMNLKCENININTNSLQEVINNFRQTYIENYKKYITDTEYNNFITNLSSQPKFKETDKDYTKLLNQDERKAIYKSFIDKISDKNILKELHQQMDFVSKNNIQNLSQEFQNFETKQDNQGLNSEKAKEEGQKFYNSILGIVNSHKKDYSANGIITPDGHIQTENIGDYIKTQRKFLTENFKDKPMTFKDLDNLMHLDNF
jgi:hypothetical protein